jgi:hypothetical protein
MEETFLKEEEDISHAFIYYPADESHGGRFFPMETLIAGGGHINLQDTPLFTRIWW